jgi:hypothetical protein
MKVQGDTEPDFLPWGVIQEVATVLEKARAITPSD